MLKALVAVDGSDSSLSAVRHAIRLGHDREPLDLHLLNVQPPVGGDVTTFVDRENIEGFHRDEGEKVINPAGELVRAAGLHCTKHIFVGHFAETIAQVAKDLGCAMVIMGAHGRNGLMGALMGSVGQQVIGLIDPGIPVTFVKAGYGASSARP
jgi:nucleotide-binding universal stress UspA family protein